MFNTKIILAAISVFAFTGARVKTIRTTKCINHANGGRTKIFKKTTIRSHRHEHHPMFVRKTTILVPTSTFVTHTVRQPAFFSRPCHANTSLINISI